MIEWFFNLGAANKINFFVALISFFATLAAWSTTRLSKKQTDLIVEEFNYNSMAILIANPVSFNVPFKELDIFLSNENSTLIQEDWRLPIENVGRGNAFDVRAHIKLENKESYLTHNEIQRMRYNRTTKIPLDYCMNFNEDPNGLIMHIELIKNPSLKKEHFSTAHFSPTIPVIKDKERNYISLPNYIKPLIVEAYRSAYEKHEDFNYIESPQLTLEISFITEQMFYRSKDEQERIVKQFNLLPIIHDNEQSFSVLFQVINKDDGNSI